MQKQMLRNISVLLVYSWNRELKRDLEHNGGLKKKKTETKKEKEKGGREKWGREWKRRKEGKEGRKRKKEKYR